MKTGNKSLIQILYGIEWWCRRKGERRLMCGCCCNAARLIATVLPRCTRCNLTLGHWPLQSSYFIRGPFVSLQWHGDGLRRSELNQPLPTRPNNVFIHHQGQCVWGSGLAICTNQGQLSPWLVTFCSCNILT